MPIAEDLPLYVAEPTSLNRTEAAFLAREIDSALAHRLRRAGWTVGKLQQETASALVELGLTSESIELLRGAGRPEIPFDNLVMTLIANRFTCCVCRDPSKQIVVHHIRPWAQSRDHSPANLAVLCPDDHGKAHTTSTLTRNLDARTLHRFKASWEKSVSESDAAALLEVSREEHSAWWYFNHRRLFEFAKAQHVELARLSRAAQQFGVTDTHGQIKDRPLDGMHMYRGSDGMILYAYMREVLHAILEGVSVLNISDRLDRSVLASVLRPGAIIFVQGAHVFSRKTKSIEGPDQICTGRRKANLIEISYVFDGWEATSTSSHVWLSGRRKAASILRVVDLERRGRILSIRGTALAIGAPFEGMKTRNYENYFPTIDNECEYYLADNEFSAK